MLFPLDILRDLICDTGYAGGLNSSNNKDGIVFYSYFSRRFLPLIIWSLVYIFLVSISLSSNFTTFLNTCDTYLSHILRCSFDFCFKR